MSYHRYNVGGLFDDMQQAAQQEMERQCPPGSEYNMMLARISDLEANWHPTGYYKWNEMADVVAETVKLAGLASSAAIKFFGMDSLPSSKDRVRAASNKYNDIGKQAIDYTLAWKAGYASGKLVAAPGFKQWVIDDLKAAAALYREVEINICTTPGWVTTAASIGRGFTAVGDAAKRVGRAVVTVAEGAVKAVERTGSILGFVLPLLPIAALGIGAVIVYRRFGKR